MRAHLPEGLPARFLDPQVGSTLLCEFLDIATRSDQQKIVKIEGVKLAIQSHKASFRGLPTSKRLQAQIGTFYSLPDERRKLWQHYFQIAMLDKFGEYPISVPSFEYQAFERFDPDFLKYEPDEAHLDESFSDFPGIVKSLSNSPGWQRPALSVWPNLRRELLGWEALPPPRRDAVTLTTFAVATILDDVRFLEWAASRAETLVEEYAFALEDEASDTKATPGQQEERIPTAEDDTTEIIGKWNDACAAVGEIASILEGYPPKPGRLDDLIEQVHVLEDLREPLAAMLDVRRAEKLLERVMDAVDEMSRQGGVSWLDQFGGKILAQWKLFFAGPDGVDVERLRRDVERVERELNLAMAEWQTLKEDEQSSLRRLRELEAGAHESGDLLGIDDRKVELQEKVTETTRKLRDARLRIFQVIAPDDEEFDPSRDYERECEGVGAFRTVRVHEDVVQEPEALFDRESGEEVAETAAPATATGDVLKQNENPSVAIDDDRQSPVEPDGLSSDTEAGGVGEATAEPPDTEPDSRVADLTAANDESRPVRPSHSDADLAAAERTDDVITEKREQYMAAVAVLWQAINIGRPGIAYYIAKLLIERGGDERVLPPANVIAASALAVHVQSADGEVVTTLRSLLEGVEPDSFSHTDRGVRDAVSLLMFSAALRPALFAPATGAASMLRRISTPESLTPVYDLAKSAADHADRLQGIRLDATLIRTTLRGGWQDEFTMFSARVQDWCKRAKSQRIIFHRANRVWHDLLSERGCLAELIGLISKDDAGGSDRIEAIRKQIGDQKAFNELVHRTDRKYRKGNPIQGSALKQLWDHVQPAIDLSTEWLHLMGAKPDSKGFVVERIEALRRDLLRHGREAIAAIDRHVANVSSAALSATLRHARHAIETLFQIFDEDASLARVVDESPDIIRSRDLLYVTELDLDTQYRPAPHHTDVRVLELLLDIGTHAKSLSDAFKARLSRGDLTGAQLAWEGMDANGDAEADRCRTSLDRDVERQRRELKKTHAVEEARLEHAFCRGQLDIDKRDELAAQLVSLKRLTQPVSSSELPLNVADAVARAQSALTQVRQSVEMAAVARIGEAMSRLETVVSANPETDGRSVVEQAIESGDVLTANELMSRMEAGESVDLPSVTDDPFQEFMSALEEVDRTVGAPGGLGAQVTLRRVAARERIAGASFEKLSEEEAAQAASLLKAWYTLSKARRVDKQALQDLLLRLGFKVRKLATVSSRGRAQADLVTETIEDRSLCPSRQFGSEARGHYRVLLNWNRSADDSITESLGVVGGLPTLVLHFGCLGAEREKLRTLAIQTHRLYLIVDESLILFLASRPSGRLSALFRCSLPFTSADPYATTSSLVPPELFYGREREQREITDPSGACFIYGGRQLGKTALLRRVERDFNRSREANVAKWIDLKVNEIGYARGPRDVWPFLQQELHGLGVVPKRRRELDPGDRRQVQSLLDKIRQWLNEREDRRLLLLLDEADAFLERDARTEFSESARLKGLMDETERRFKVVFAGLHNVLRTTRQANHPLAHFGDPIRVGAMLSNGEWRQAQALVREPLQAVGCRFERDELSTRVLAQTNYYPSLIQLYGAELVRRLRDSNKTFPYAIGDDDLNAAYSSHELGSAIRERFLLTLQLDQRYEVIAYGLAQEFQGEAELGQGLDQDTIAEIAKAWWTEGFEVTDVEFGMLLHEMEGLGVLRSLDQGRRYTLRNPNILLLLGNSDDIEKALSKERQPPMVYEPASFHARYPEKHHSSKQRGPLTYLQESDLRATGGVTIVSGCLAAGLEHVAEFLQQRIEPDLFRILPSVSDLDEFERKLKDMRPERNMVTVCLVPLTASWDASWVSAARRVLTKKSGGRQIGSRLVFTATPEMHWRILEDEPDLKHVDRIEIGPWDRRFLRHWLDDINFTADADHLNELMEVSGGWPAVLDRFGEKAPRKSWSKRIEELNRELVNDGTMLDFGVYSEEVERILRALLSEDVFDADSIAVAADEVGLDNDLVWRRVKWSESLGLVSPTGDSRWSFNPLIRRLLEAGDPE